MNKLVYIFIAVLLPLVTMAGGGHGNEHEHGGQQSSHGTTHSEGGYKDKADSHQSGVGRAAESAEVTRIIEVDLLDTMRFDFSPDLSLKRGEAVKFVVTNRGAIRHEFSIGSESEQLKHREMMRSMPGMTHQDANTVTLDAGQTTELMWIFDGEENPVFACNIPGHAEAGMVVGSELN